VHVKEFQPSAPCLVLKIEAPHLSFCGRGRRSSSGGRHLLPTGGDARHGSPRCARNRARGAFEGLPGDRLTFRVHGSVSFRLGLISGDRNRPQAPSRHDALEHAFERRAFLGGSVRGLIKQSGDTPLKYRRQPVGALQVQSTRRPSSWSKCQVSTLRSGLGIGLDAPCRCRP
jgi:hypothetical protein